MEKKKIFSLRKTTMGVGSLAIATTLIFGGGEILPGIEGPAHVQAAVKEPNADLINTVDSKTMPKGSVVSLLNYEVVPSSSGVEYTSNVKLRIDNPQPGEFIFIKDVFFIERTNGDQQHVSSTYSYPSGTPVTDATSGQKIGEMSSSFLTLDENLDKSLEYVEIELEANNKLPNSIVRDDSGPVSAGVGFGIDYISELLAYDNDVHFAKSWYNSLSSRTATGVPSFNSLSYETSHDLGNNAKSGLIDLHTTIRKDYLMEESGLNVSKKGDYLDIRYSVKDNPALEKYHFKEDVKNSDLGVGLSLIDGFALGGSGQDKGLYRTNVSHDNLFSVKVVENNKEEVIARYILNRDLDNEKLDETVYRFGLNKSLYFDNLYDEVVNNDTAGEILNKKSSTRYDFNEGYRPKIYAFNKDGAEAFNSTVTYGSTPGTSFIRGFTKFVENPPEPTPPEPEPETPTPDCDCDALIEKTEKKIEGLNNLINELKADEGANKDLIDELTNRVETLESEKTRLQGLIKENVTKIDILEGQISNLENALDETNQSITDAEKRLNDRINESNTKIENLNRDLQTEKDKLNNLRDDFEALKKQHADDKAAYEKEKERLIEEITTIKENINTITDELSDLGIETERQAKEIESLKTNLESAKEDINTLLELLVELEANHKDDVDTILDLTVELEDKLNGAINSSKEIQDAQQKDIDESNTKIENLNKDLQTEKDKLNDLRNDFEALKEQHAVDKAAYEKEKERLTKEITTIKENINTITDELLDLGVETERQAKEIESLKSNLESAKEDIDTLLELLVELEANHKNDVDTILDLTVELEDKLNGAINSSKEIQDAQQKDIVSLKEQLEALKASDKETQQEIEKLQAVLDALKSQGNTDVNININNNNEVVITEADNKEDVEAEVEAPEEEAESEDNKDEDKQTDDSKDAGEDSADKDSDKKESDDNADDSKVPESDENSNDDDKDDSKENVKEESDDKDNEASDDKNINVDNNNTVTTDKDKEASDNADKNNGAYDGGNIEKPDAPAEDKASEDKNDSKDVADKDNDADTDSDKDSGIGLTNNDINKDNTDNKSDDINKDGINKNGVLPDTGAPIAIGGIGALLVTALGALGFRRFKNKDEE